MSSLIVRIKIMVMLPFYFQNYKIVNMWEMPCVSVHIISALLKHGAGESSLLFVSSLAVEHICGVCVYFMLCTHLSSIHPYKIWSEENGKTTLGNWKNNVWSV